MKHHKILSILSARMRLVIFVTVLAVGTAIGAHLMLPQIYVANGSLIIDAKGLDPVTGAPGHAQSNDALMATQADIITSRVVALRVAASVKPSSADSSQSPEARAQALLSKLTVKPASDSNVIRLRFEDADPGVAAAVVNAFAAEYLKASLELRLDPARRQSAWFEAQLQGLRSAVETSRQRLSDYQREHGVIVTDDRLDVENARMETISQQLAEAQRVSQGTEARLQQTEQAVRTGRLNEVPEIMGSSLLQSLKGDLGRAEGKLAEQRERFGSNHPLYQSAEAEVRSLRQKLDAEVQLARGSIGQSAQIARAQVAELQRTVNEQKARLLELTRERDEVSVRDREARNAQSAYDSALARASQLRLESELNQTSAAVLEIATPPEHPAGMTLPLIGVLSLVFGSMLGAGCGLLAETLDRRVRDRDQLKADASIDVLCDVPHLRPTFRVVRTRATRQFDVSSPATSVA